MTKFQEASKHIALREVFYEVRFNLFRKAYAHAHMLFVRKQSIIEANKFMETAIKDYGTAREFKAQIEAL